MHVLVVGNDEQTRLVWTEMLVDMGFRVSVLKDRMNGVLAALTRKLDLVILDMFLNGDMCEDIIALVKVRSPDTPMIIVAGTNAFLHGEHRRELGVDYLLRKPVRLDELEAIVWHLTKKDYVLGGCKFIQTAGISVSRAPEMSLM